MLHTDVVIITDHFGSAREWADSLRHRRIHSHIFGFEQVIKDITPVEDYILTVVNSHNNSEDALSICRQVRSVTGMPIMLLTFERDDRYHLRAYSAGADECVRKPLSSLLFNAKVGAWLRQAQSQGAQISGVDFENSNGYVGEPDTFIPRANSGQRGFSIDPKTRLLTTSDGSSLRLSMQECTLLRVLVANQGVVMSFNFLGERIWDSFGPDDRQLLTNLVYRLRKKLEAPPVSLNGIRTVKDIGYIYD